MKKAITIFLMLLLATACSVHAQYAKKNSVEVGGAVSYSSTTAVINGSTSGDPITLLQFAPYAGYFVADQISIGLSPTVISFKASGSTTTAYGIYAVPGYTFTSRGNAFPYVQALLGYTGLSTSGSPDLTGFSYGGKAGVKVSVGTGGLIDIGVEYSLITLNPKGADKRNGYNNFAILIGFSVF